MDVVVLTRAVFGILFWPILAIFVVFGDLGVILWLFVTNLPLALIPIVLSGIAIFAFARWERRHSRGTD